jgi:type II secretory pathway pseudopilin PulG
LKKQVPSWIKLPGHGSAGFTLVEALLAVATLGLMATGIGTLYMSGLNALDVQAEEMMVQSQLRSEMERVVSSPFDQLTNRTEVVSLAGLTYTSQWVAINVDLDGDNNPEPDAMQVTVTINGRALTVLQVDDRDKVGKL